MAKFCKGWATVHIVISAIGTIVLGIIGLAGGNFGMVLTALLTGAYGVLSMVPIYAVGQVTEEVEELRWQVRQNAASNAEKRNNDYALLAKDGWKCACGRVNADYVSTCACGTSKADVTEQ